MNIWSLLILKPESDQESQQPGSKQTHKHTAASEALCYKFLLFISLSYESQMNGWLCHVTSVIFKRQQIDD